MTAVCALHASLVVEQERVAGGVSRAMSIGVDSAPTDCPSMGIIGDYDNSIMESLQGTLQLEVLRHDDLGNPRRTCRIHLRADRMLVQRQLAKFRSRNALDGRVRSPPHRPNVPQDNHVTPHRGCPRWGVKLRNRHNSTGQVSYRVHATSTGRRPPAP
jgi:hypothetical protein